MTIEIQDKYGISHFLNMPSDLTLVDMSIAIYLHIEVFNNV